MCWTYHEGIPNKPYWSLPPEDVGVRRVDAGKSLTAEIFKW